MNQRYVKNLIYGMQDILKIFEDKRRAKEDVSGLKILFTTD